MVSVYINSSIWQEIFGVSNDTAFQTIIPTVIAILIFILGLLFERLKNILANHRKSSQIRSYVISQINVLINVSQEQKKNIQEFIRSLEIEQIFNLKFELRVGFHSQHIKNIPSVDLFRIFVLEFYWRKTERLKVFNILLEQMDLVDGLSSEFAQSFAYTREKSSKYEDEWNKNLELVADTHDAWATKLGAEKINKDPFLSQLFRVYHLWAKTEKYTDMYVAEKILVEPVLKLVKETQPNEYGFKLLRPILGCSSAIINHRNLRMAKIEEFNYYISQIDFVIEKLNVFINLYK